MYYFSYSTFEHDEFTYRPYSLYHEGSAIIKTGAGISANALKLYITNLADGPVQIFDFDNRCYLLDGNDYYYYNGIEAGRVTDIAYVPIINQGRAPHGTGGTAYQELNHLSDSWRESFSGTADATEYKLQLPGLLGIKPDSIEKCWVNGTELATGFTLGADGFTVTFGTAPGLGDNNVIIQLTK
ncbi:MAG TPA: hypothetical protein PLJ97_02855, partial [Candidatus Saccharibacteria bacterium]|nr:hypothetical protein [Candidatus Saccharibacteria bacterium]